jgi:hypothetical protein
VSRANGVLPLVDGVWLYWPGCSCCGRAAEEASIALLGATQGRFRAGQLVLVVTCCGRRREWTVGLPGRNPEGADLRADVLAWGPWIADMIDAPPVTS